MNSLRDLRLGARLGIGFGSVLVLMAIIVGIGAVRLQAVGGLAHQVIDEDWVKADAASSIDRHARANARYAMEALITTDAAKIEKIRDQIQSNMKEVDVALEKLDRLVARAEGKALLGRIKEGRRKFVAAIIEVQKLVSQGRREEATRMMLVDALPAIDALQTDIDGLAAFQRRVVETSGAEIGEAIASAWTSMLVVGLSALLIGALFAWWLTRSITRPIAEAVRVAETVAAGDLRSQIEVRSADETGQLLTALKNMNASLESIVGRVRQASESIATGSGQIATGNADLSQRTEEQASNLQQTAASMEELTTTVAQNSDAARQANDLAAAASKAAVLGGEAVGRVVGTMQAISQSSRKIAEIIGVIDGIAFQTNILALNAAVEAARAGEQGRGFAVVAGEVRSLAQRSAEAAKEIRVLIGESVEKVESGSRQVDEAGRSMEDIVAQVKRVSDLIGDISSASGEQSSGIAQIGDAVAQLDQVTQQNAALVEESAAAAESLKQQSDSLAEMVSVFKLKDGEAHRVIENARLGSRIAAAFSQPGPRAAQPGPRAAQPGLRAATKAATPPATTVGAEAGEWASF